MGKKNEIIKFFNEIENIDFNTDLSTSADRRLTLVKKTNNLIIPNISERKVRTLGLKLQYKPKGKFHYKISITDLGKLKIQKGGELLKCSIFNSSEYSAEGDFEADGKRNEFPIDFFLCPRVIEDYGEILDNNTECIVHFIITITCANNKDFKTLIEKGEIVLKMLKVQSEVVLQYIPKIKEGTYTMSQNTPREIGTLKITHSSKLKCAPPIESVNYNLQTLIKEKEGNKYTEYGAALYCLKGGTYNNSCKINIGTELSVPHLGSGDELNIPVLFYSNRVMSNPQPSDTFKLQLKSNDINCTLDNSLFVLNRNRSLTRLDAKLCTQDCHCWDILATEIAPEPCSIKLNVPAKVNHVLIFRNTAEVHPNANIHSCVKVWGVKIVAKINDETTAKRLQLHKNKTLNDVVSLRDKETSNPIKEAKYVDIDPNSQWSMKICFDSQHIKSLDPDPNESGTWIPIDVILSFYYIEDSDGRTYKHNPTTIDMQGLKVIERTFIYKVLLTTVSTSPWLCVDFGTSAIVAASASFDQGAPNISLINLNERKNRLLSAAFPDKKSNKDEEGVLINSIFCLNPSPDMGHPFDSVTGIDIDFKKYTFLLSPGDDVLNADYMAPNLKLLMGYDKIPNIFPVIQQSYQYAAQEGVDGQGLPIIHKYSLIEDGYPTELMHLEKITNIIYLQLFKHYLRNTADKVQQRIERLVMTVPNTYTPLQLDFIRRIARKALPELRPEEFHLVSESDAVACYYLYKREVLLKQMKKTDPSIYNNTEHRVLIYDMGAGTLDLTLMQTTKEQDSLSVKMLGKLGVSKAGNYFDHVLGQILVKAAQNEVTSINILGSDEDRRKNGAEHLSNLIEMDSRNGLGSPKERLALKAYIKKMKKQLNEDGKTHLIDLPEDNEIAKWAYSAGINYNFNALCVEDIRKDKIYEDYITSVTTNLLKDFEAYVRQTNTDFQLQQIDIVVFSGRSTQLIDIRRNVKEALNNNPNIYYVDLITETSSKDVDTNIKGGEQSTKLKTVVAEGAYHSINFMDNSNKIAIDTRKFFATFGLVQYDRTRVGRRKWIPLIQAQIPCKDKGIESEEDNSYISVTRKIIVNGNRYIDFIQSYCGNVAGCEDYSSNETISVLASMELPPNTKEAKVEFKLYIEPVKGTTKSIHLKINDQEYDLNPHMDIQKNIALRRSLWPVVFS